MRQQSQANNPPPSSQSRAAPTQVSSHNQSNYPHGPYVNANQPYYQVHEHPSHHTLDKGPVERQTESRVYDQRHPSQSHPSQSHQPSFANVERAMPPDFEIIRQGYGITNNMRHDIVEYFRDSHTQKEYKNPADFLKHRLDSKYGPFWFVFMWEDKKNNTTQYSYYNNDDKVFEFRGLGWQALVYSFNPTENYNQRPMIRETIQPQYPPSNQPRDRDIYHDDRKYSATAAQRPVQYPGSYWGPQERFEEPQFTRYPYPSLMSRPSDGGRRYPY